MHEGIGQIEQFSSQAGAPPGRIGGHAAQAVGGFIQVGLAHVGGAADHVVAEDRRDVQGGVGVIAVEVRGFARKTRAQDGIAQVDDAVGGDALEER